MTYWHISTGGAGRHCVSYIHRDQSFHQPEYRRIHVPKVFDEELHAHDDTNWDNGEDQCRHQIIQNERLLRMADVCLPMPIVRPVSPHGKDALALAEHLHFGIEKVGDDEGTDNSR